MTWVEKYRPRTLSQVVGHEQIVRALMAYVVSRNPPHMIFAGPAGTGKTTCAVALAHELYGEELEQHYKELNASDDRGINVIRNEIKTFASSTFSARGEVRLLFLDEADHLTNDAQAALRRTIEQYSHIFRMIISCNYSSRLIAPIASRCAVFRFRPLTNAAVSTILNRITDAEGLTIGADGFETIIELAHGDLRRAVNLLQMCGMAEKPIDAALVRALSASVDPPKLLAVIRAALGGEFRSAQAQLTAIMDEYGIAGQELLRQLHGVLFANAAQLGLGEHALARVVERLGEIDFHIAEGCRAPIQLDSLLARLVQVGHQT